MSNVKVRSLLFNNFQRLCSDSVSRTVVHLARSSARRHHNGCITGWRVSTLVRCRSTGRVCADTAESIGGRGERWTGGGRVLCVCRALGRYDCQQVGVVQSIVMNLSFTFRHTYPYSLAVNREIGYDHLLSELLMAMAPAGVQIPVRYNRSVDRRLICPAIFHARIKATDTCRR
jgi:hypothetical protein